MHNTFGLLFHNPENVSDCSGRTLKASTYLIDERLKQFANYFVETWIYEDCFYPSKFKVLASLKLTSTTNTSESFHVNLKNIFFSTFAVYFTMGNIVIEEVQTVVYCKLRSFSKPKTTQNKILK